MRACIHVCVCVFVVCVCVCVYYCVNGVFCDVCVVTGCGCGIGVMCNNRFVVWYYVVMF